MGVDQSARRTIWSTSLGLTAGAIAYFLILFDFGTDLGRTAVRSRFASNFFDLQADAFLNGRVWVPDGSLAIEGFERGGHTYMYFPPFPAIARLPVMWVTREFDGRLTLLFMALAWVLFATMVVKLLWLARSIVHGDRPVARTEAVAMGLFIALATGGTVVTFDASLPWVYHEVYLWAVGLVVGTMYWLVRTIVEPTGQSFRWLGAFALCTILTRTTGGWAVCLTILGVAVWFLLSRRGARNALWFALAGGIPLTLGIAYNWVKFRHPYLFPLEDQVWTQVNAHRREALEVNGGTITGSQFFTTSLVNYFRPDGIRLVDYFPYITLPARPAPSYDGAFLDQSYRTGSITAFMPGLFLLMLASLPVLLRRRLSLGHRALLVALLGSVLVTGGVMGYGYLAYRYTSEFVPALVIGGAVGLCGVTKMVADRRVLGSAFCVVLAGLTAFGIAANMLTGYATSATTVRGERLVDYVSHQTGVEKLVSRGVGLPQRGSADDLYIEGDCEAVYLHTGDAYEPWILVDQRDRIAEISTGSDYSAATIPLFAVDANQRRIVSLETNEDYEARIVVTDESGAPSYGPWFGVYRDNRVRVALRAHSDYGMVQVSSEPGGVHSWVPYVEWDQDWNAAPGRIVSLIASSVPGPETGLSVEEIPGVRSTLCRELEGDV